jgi:flagellin
LTETTYRISETNVTVTEADQITVANTLMSHLNDYASADSYGGSFELTTATTNSANDYVNFEVDSTGNIQTLSSYEVDFDNGQTSFDMDVVYTHSDGVTTYTDRLNIVLTNDYSDDTDLVLASVDVSTADGAREAMFSIGSVIDRMSTTQTIIGAKKNQLISNLQRLSAVLIQTQIARGRIFDADAAGEASRLAKQQILAGAASQMISLASVQKRRLIDMLL